MGGPILSRTALIGEIMLPFGYKFKVVSAFKLSQSREAAKAGSAKNAALAAERRKIYNEFPNSCLECKRLILVSDDADAGKFAEVKKKKFCNHSCGAKYHNRVFGYSHRKSKVRVCSSCGAEYTSPHRKTDRCSDCKLLPRISILGTRKKSECLVQEIRTHARLILFRAKERSCEVCGYNIRVDCCHVKPIKEFSESALLSEINDVGNLKALCPNHHVEFDLGILKIEG